MAPKRTRTGVEVVIENPAVIGGGNVGLLTNFTGTTPDLGRTVDALLAAGVRITTLLGPEHGLNGSAQAGETETSTRDARTGLPVVDTYLKTGGELDELIRASGVDTIVFDMQDVGARFFTYVWTLYDVLQSAARTGIRVVVLDRPNPLGGAVVSGPGLDVHRFGSFVGRSDVHQRHGLTVGELARLFSIRDLPAQGLDVDLEVVRMTGWDAARDFDATGLPWVPPSPNMPTLDTAYAFAGIALLEGTNISEGRGTTRPFEMLGALYIDGRLSTALRERSIPGVLFREIWFTPTFHKYAGETLRGVQLHVTDRAQFDPVSTALAVLELAAELYPDRFNVLPPTEPGADRPRYALDRLWGSASLRDALACGAPLAPLNPGVRAVSDAYGDNVLLYPRPSPPGEGDNGSE